MDKQIVKKITTSKVKQYPDTQYIQELKDKRKYITNGDIAVIFNGYEESILSLRVNPTLELDNILVTDKPYKPLTEEYEKLMSNVKEYREKEETEFILIDDIGIDTKYIEMATKIIGKRELKKTKYTTTDYTLYLKSTKYDIAIMRLRLDTDAIEELRKKKEEYLKRGKRSKK